MRIKKITIYYYIYTLVSDALNLFVQLDKQHFDIIVIEYSYFYPFFNSDCLF